MDSTAIMSRIPEALATFRVSTQSLGSLCASMDARVRQGTRGMQLHVTEGGTGERNASSDHPSGGTRGRQWERELTSWVGPDSRNVYLTSDLRKR